jgi:carbohydrate diacid regulator
MLQISKQDAAEIVDQLSTLIGLKINIVGADAVIIANSDRERVGDFHEATKQIIKNNLDELVVMNDHQFKGTHAGTNLPLVIDGQIIGVVGITGPYKEARAYGQIIKKMTEILIQGKERESRLTRRKQEKERFCNEWTCDPQTEITDNLLSRGLALNIDITKPRRLMLISLQSSKDEETLKDSCIHAVEVQDQGNVAFRNLNHVVAAVMDRSDSQMEEFAKLLVKKYGSEETQVHIGIDEGYTDMLRIYDQYAKARKALVSGSQLGPKTYCFYHELNIELLLEEIPIHVKQQYIEKVFAGFSKEEIAESTHTIQIFYEENGSIKRAADRLNIHPNTLQYKLKRIKTRTGLDPRKLRSAAPFSLAKLFLIELNNL